MSTPSRTTLSPTQTVFIIVVIVAGQCALRGEYYSETKKLGLIALTVFGLFVVLNNRKILKRIKPETLLDRTTYEEISPSFLTSITTFVILCWIVLRQLKCKFPDSEIWPLLEEYKILNTIGNRLIIGAFGTMGVSMFSFIQAN